MTKINNYQISKSVYKSYEGDRGHMPDYVRQSEKDFTVGRIKRWGSVAVVGTLGVLGAGHFLSNHEPRALSDTRIEQTDLPALANHPEK